MQDVATGMIVLQPGTDQIIFPHLVELLTLLESVSRVAFCHQCYLPGSACRCLETSSTASTASHYGTVVERNCRSNLRPQLGAGWERRWIGASIWIFIHGRRLRLGSAFYGLPKTPWGTFCYSPTPPPAGRASFLESQLMAIRYGLTAPPEPLRLPQPTWMPPATQNRRRTQLPPPPPRTDSVSTTDQGQQTTAPDTGLRGKEPGEPDDPGRAAVIMDPSRQSYTSLQALGRSGGTSRRTPDWNPLAILQTTVVGVGKRLGLLHGSLLQAQLQE